MGGRPPIATCRRLGSIIPCVEKGRKRQGLLDSTWARLRLSGVRAPIPENVQARRIFCIRVADWGALAGRLRV